METRCIAGLEEINPDAWECPELNADFRGLHWRDVPHAVIRAHAYDHRLFSGAGWHFYLPAFLLAAFDDPEVSGPLQRYLTIDPTSPSEFVKTFDRLTPAQKSAVRSFLEFMRDQSEGEMTRAWWSETLDLYWGRDWT